MLAINCQAVKVSKDNGGCHFFVNTESNQYMQLLAAFSPDEREQLNQGPQALLASLAEKMPEIVLGSVVTRCYFLR